MAERHRSELVAQERSGHTAVVEDNLLYVWGGYVVRTMLLSNVLHFPHRFYSEVFSPLSFISKVSSVEI